MPITVKLRYLRIAPRKVRLVADLIRGKSVEEAQNILNFTSKRATVPLAKLLKSGISAAREAPSETPQNLYISKITVDQGPILKRWRARARGRAAEIQKKTSHISLTLDVKEGAPKKVVKKAKPAPVKKPEKVVGPEKKETEKPRPRPFRPERAARRPSFVKDLKRVFRRKAF